MTNKPIENFYAGNVEVAVWENQDGESKVFHSVTAKRTYIDGNGQWKDAGTVHLLPQQIPDMVLALQKSHEFLRMGLRQRRRQQADKTDGIANSEKAQSGSPGGEQTGSDELLVELAGNGSEKETAGFAGRVGQSRGSKRSR
jgi:hypothetical protein